MLTQLQLLHATISTSCTHNTSVYTPTCTYCPSSSFPPDSIRSHHIISLLYHHIFKIGFQQLSFYSHEIVTHLLIWVWRGGGGVWPFPLDGVANDIVKIIVRQWSDAFPIYLQDHITIFTKYISTAIFYMSRETTAHTIDRYHLYYTSLNHTNVVPPYLSLQRLLHQDWSLTMYVPVYVDINNPPTWQM